MNKDEQKSSLEKKILNELVQNCRANLDEIGKKCGCSRYKVGRVIKKLEENKTIIGYSAIIDPRKLNQNYYLLLIKRTPLPLTNDITKFACRGKVTDLFPNIDVDFVDSMYINGYYDFIITFTANSIVKAKEFCNRMLENYNPYIEKTELLEMVMPFRLERIRVYQLEEKSKIL
ncbi:hypothetical protein AYK20_08740 [Thermoplasmatales archaeon SG8-52-1]|nr:MAG: hypothetical protein AYK20_08740 [Thermoplasmatales archaeon SG8-52-1]